MVFASKTGCGSLSAGSFWSFTAMHFKLQGPRGDTGQVGHPVIDKAEEDAGVEQQPYRSVGKGRSRKLSGSGASKSSAI
jgi:hypothetical protein